MYLLGSIWHISAREITLVQANLSDLDQYIFRASTREGYLGQETKDFHMKPLSLKVGEMKQCILFYLTVNSITVAKSG